MFTEVGHNQQHVICKVCLAHNGQKVIQHCHVADHTSSKKHQQNLVRATQKKGQQALLRLGTFKGFQSTPCKMQDELFKMQDELFEIHGEMERNLSVLPQSTVTTEKSGNPPVTLSQFWDEFQVECTIFLDNYFNEMQWKIKGDEPLFSSVLAPLRKN